MESVMGISETRTSSVMVLPIGQLLVVGEYIVPQDLAFALEHQRHSKEPIGEILVRMGALDRKDLDIVLSMQKVLITR
jgi:hypothetical protein